MRGLEGSVAIVTGGASGIGAAVVERLADEGATVVVADVQDELGLALAERLTASAGRRVEFVHTDVTDEASIAAVVDQTVAQHGRLDTFHANAGVFGALGPIADQQLEQVDLTIAVNLRGVLLCLKHAARVMQPQGRGSIIVTGSPGGIIGGAGPHVYSATKAAVMGLARSVAAELRPFGIRVNSLVPGAIVSGMTAAALVGDAGALDRASDTMSGSSMLGRAGQPGDIAGAVAFLASDDSIYMTGTEMYVDAGYTFASGSAAFAQTKYSGAAPLLEGGRRDMPDAQEGAQ